MPPNEPETRPNFERSNRLEPSDEIMKNKTETTEEKNDGKWFFQRYELMYGKIVVQIILNIFTFYSLYHYPYFQSYKTTLWAIAISIYSQFGFCAGAHRLWSHRSFKANALLRTIIALGHDIGHFMPIETWVRLHRVHHRWTDTPADPHNSKQGFFFSHMGWIFIKRPRIVTEKYKHIDMSDVNADPIVVFTDKYMHQIGLVLNLIITAIPVYLWSETWANSLMAQMIRFLYVLHSAASINSFAHMFGDQPYDKNIKASENKLVVFLTNGEGWHNYHHSFPVDYRSAEIGGSTKYDINARLIEFFAMLGWAWDLKVPKHSLVKLTMDRKGDGSVLSSMIS